MTEGGQPARFREPAALPWRDPVFVVCPRCGSRATAKETGRSTALLLCLNCTLTREWAGDRLHVRVGGRPVMLRRDHEYWQNPDTGRYLKYDEYELAEGQDDPVPLSHAVASVRPMPTALFPHHHWADADGLAAPDPQLAATGYFRNDPDSDSRNLQRWHQQLWNRRLADGTGLELTSPRRGVLLTDGGIALTSDAAVPAWEHWSQVQALKPETDELVRARGRGSIHQLGWRLYDMGCFLLFPGLQIGRQHTINQARGWTPAIADRLDLTLECIRRYYDELPEASAPELPAGYELTNPLGPVLHRYRTFFDVFGSFDNYVAFWMLEDLVTDEPGGPQVRFLMPRDESGPYDFQRESGLPRTADAYSEYLIAADDFVQARNRRLAAYAATITRLADPICQACLDTSDGVHQRWTL